jgi:hypothetical protein
MTRAHIRVSITLASALALPGCMKPNPLGDALDNQADAGDGDGESGDGDPGDGDPGDGDPGDGDPGDGDPGDGDGDGEPGDGDGESGDGDPGDGDGDGDPLLPDLGGDSQSCEPLDSLEDACAACIADDCCPEATLCEDAEACECLVDCTLSGGSSGSCKNLCGPKPEDVPQVGLLLSCAHDWCVDDC